MARMKWRAADSRFFDFAMQSRRGRRRKKANGGRCGFEIEVAIAPPVFGQTRSIEFALGVIFVSETRAAASWLPSVLSGLWVRGFSGSAATRLNLIAGLRVSFADRGGRRDGPDFCFSRRDLRMSWRRMRGPHQGRFLPRYQAGRSAFRRRPSMGGLDRSTVLPFSPVRSATLPVGTSTGLALQARPARHC